jgi:hypothetical protein
MNRPTRTDKDKEKDMARERSGSDPSAESGVVSSGVGSYVYWLLHSEELQSQSGNDLRILATQTERELSILYARHAILTILANLSVTKNVLGVTSLGGAKKLIGLLKLAYSFDLITGRYTQIQTHSLLHVDVCSLLTSPFCGK